LFVGYVSQVIAMKKQIQLMESQINNDKIKTNSDTTLNVLVIWTNGLTSNMTRSRKIVEKLNKEQCQSLFDCNSFKVTSDIYKEICIRMGKNEPKDDSQHNLTSEEINVLRDDCIKYLNLLEVVLTSLQLNTVNSSVIEQQFKYLVKPKDKESVLQNFRISCGGKEAYPSIEEYCDKILKENK
ncbi:MAG: hypothetical protein IJY73_02375, partial [Oscillospiraceae bacterium]|nr:hypothetical protein [Oscillospiraceae bacterium]